MSGFTAGWAIETLIASSLLMGFVLLVRRHAQRVLGTQLAYWLWALPALRMALPPLPAAWRENATLPIADASEVVLIYLSPVADTASDIAATAAPAFPWLLLVGGAWTLGALGFFLWHGAAHFAYVRRILAPPATRARLGDGTTLVESEQAVGPVAFGVLRRFVAVPTDFAERWDADERRLALAHELGHHARGDLIANWIALAVLALHWWNPLAWAAYRKFRADQEMANDARVLAGLPPMQRHAYACAIVKAAHGRAVTAACHLHTIEDLKGRLRMLKNSRKSRKVVAAGAMGIGALTVVGLGLTASSAAAEKIRTVATTQVTAMTTETSGTPAAPASPAASATPVKAKKVIVVRDGTATTYEGADAEAYLAKNADVDAAMIEADASRQVSVEARAAARVAGVEARMAAREARLAALEGSRQSRVVIRTKDGKVTRYEGADADAYWRKHGRTVAPLAPMPPMPPNLSVVLPPMPPVAPSVFTGKDGRVVVRGAGGKSFDFTVPRIVSRDNCPRGNSREFTLREKDGKRDVTVICTNRIEAFSTSQAKFGQWQARLGMQNALGGLETGRKAIEANRNLTDAQRAEALAGIASARVEIERELKDLKD